MTNAYGILDNKSLVEVYPKDNFILIEGVVKNVMTGDYEIITITKQSLGLKDSDKIIPIGAVQAYGNNATGNLSWHMHQVLKDTNIYVLPSVEIANTNIKLKVYGGADPETGPVESNISYRAVLLKL